MLQRLEDLFRRRSSFEVIRATVSLLLCACAVVLAPAAEPKTTVDPRQRARVGAPVTPLVFDGDVRDLPRPPKWRPGDPIRVVPQRHFPPPGEPRSTVPPYSSADPLVERQMRFGSRSIEGSTSFVQPSRNFDGQEFTGSHPPDTVGDVGPAHYVQAVNASNLPSDRSSQVRIYDKASPVPNELATFLVSDLGGNACLGFSDPLVLYDRQADRWLLAEMALESIALCVYVSQTGDPVSGGWYVYEFETPTLPDYPKIGIWSTDANGGDGSYVAVTNEGGIAGVIAFDRSQMLAGAAATSQRFTLPVEISLFLPTPADPIGPVGPPSGSPAILMGHRDTEFLDGVSSPQDLLEMWRLDVDWLAPAASMLTAAPAIAVSDFDSRLCGSFASCFEQPGGAQGLTSLHSFIMHQLQYRNHGTFESLFGNFTVDVDGLQTGGIRWFELRRAGGGPWALHQEGTYTGSESGDRWVGAIASDREGNVALGFNMVSPQIYPGLRYTGRRSYDSAGVMSQAETVLAAGTDTEDSNRYGDYAAMSLDPVDDCTFWFTGEYSITDNWQSRIATFRFENCPCVSPPDPPTVQLFVPGDNRIDVDWDDSLSPGAAEYVVQRSRSAGGPYTTIGTVADSSPGVGGGESYSIQDTDVSGGTRYYYVVLALDGSSCPSARSVEVSAKATGACWLRPSFNGLQSVESGISTCAIELNWAPATSGCGGPVTYDVYRSTLPGSPPSPFSLLASGLLTTEATDVNGLEEGTDYYYVVRAVDRSSGLDDGNRIYRATTATGILDQTNQIVLDEDFEDPDVLVDEWTVGTGPGNHDCGEWVRTDDPNYGPFNADGFYALALAAGCSATSTFLDSPVIDFSGPEVQSVRVRGQWRLLIAQPPPYPPPQRATIEVWDGSQWDVISPDDVLGVDASFFYVVSAQAVGNPGFRVRFNFQNVVDPDFYYSVDDVRVDADLQIGSDCETAPGVRPVPDGRFGTSPLRATRLDTAGSQIEVQFDVTSCQAPGYNLLYGSLDQVASSAVDGAECAIGSGSHAWSAVPPGDLFFLVVGTDGDATESRWGDSSFGERGGLTASGQCGAAYKNITLGCP